MSTNPNYRKYPDSWGPVVALLLALGGMALLIFGGWALAQNVTSGILMSTLGVICLVVFVVLLLTKRNLLFPETQPKTHAPN